MSKILLTAFQPYDDWQSNASWLALVELTRELPAQHSVTTRLYPVDYVGVVEQLESDVNDRYDYVIMTGQAPGRPRIEIETVALNLASDDSAEGTDCRALVPDGPLAYASRLPAESICQQIRSAGIPASVSRHGGTYLCNAAFYLALHHIAFQGLASQAAFVHLPLDTSQVAHRTEPLASMSARTAAQGLRVLLDALPEHPDRV